MAETYQEWKQFLGRPPISVDMETVGRCLRSKSVLLTGAGGYIGSALAKQCARLEIKDLVLLDSSERGIYELDRDLNEAQCNVRRTSVVGDVCDKQLLEELFALHKPEIIFHAAACKHVPLMEQNPFTAARTNVLGTYRLAEVAARHSAEQVILLSTDKAVKPLSVMGATKRVAELIVLTNSSNTQMKAVRLGNVLGSSGSVAPLFLKQIAEGGPVTVTHPDATRYFVALDEAVLLLLSALSESHKATILVSIPGRPYRIDDMARFLLMRARDRQPSIEISIEFTELRLGEKLHECLMSDEESFRETDEKALRAINSPFHPDDALRCELEKIAVSTQRRDLDGLLRAICSAVPEYQPGPWLRVQAAIADKGVR